MYSVGIIVVSDRAFRGERPDECLQVFETALEGSGLEICERGLVDDEPRNIKNALEICIARELQLVFTAGGTGCGRRDNTPGVTRSFLDKPTPGIDEAIRRFSSTKSAYAMYSCGVSGIAQRTLIINLPGSPRAVREIIEFLLPTLHHPLSLIEDTLTDCNEDVNR